MVKYILGDLFGSLSDTTRRDILQRLLVSEQTVSQLAEAYKMSLPAVSKHIKILEKSGFVIKEKRGRQWFVKLSAQALKEAAGYLGGYEAALHNRLDSFSTYLRQKTIPVTSQNNTIHASKPDNQQEITFSEVLDTDLETAWHTYTKPESIKAWWNLPGAQLTNAENDVHIGGSWRFTVQGVHGDTYLLSGIYKVVDFPYRLEYTDGIGDPGAPRPEARVVITFEQLPNGKILLRKKSVATPAVHQLNAAWYQAIGGG